MANKCNGKPKTQIEYLLIEKLAAVGKHQELRVSEEAVREAENQANKRAAMIAETISDSFFVVDRQERIAYVNQKAEGLFRERRAELIGKYAWDQFVGSIGDRLHSGYQRAISNIVGVHFEEFYEALGIWIEVHICAAEDGCSFYLHEITEGKRSAEVLKESQEYTKSLIDSSLDMIIAVDHNRNIVTFNRAAQEVFGYSPEEVLGKNVGILYAEPEQGLKVHAKTVKEGRCVQEIINVRKNGQRFPCLLSASPLCNAQGEVIGVMGVSRDITERKRSEEMLRDSEEKHRTIFENTGTAMVVIEEDTIISLVNREFERLSGFSKQEVEGNKKWTEFVVKDDLDRMLVQHRLRRERGEAALKHYEFRFVTRSRDIRNIFLSIDVIPGTKKSVASLLDITERKRVEEALESERTLLRTLIESIPDEICLKDRSLRYVIANSATVKALKAKSLSDLVGKTDLDFVRAGLAEEHLAEEKVILESGEPVINRERIQLKPGTDELERCLLTTKVPVQDQSWKTIGILVVSRDITERKKAQEALRASERRFRALFEESKDVVYMSTPEGKFVDINPAGVELFGYSSKEELLRLDLGRDIYVDPKQREQFQRRMERQRFVRDFEAVLKRKDGEKLIVLETATAVRNAQGKVVMYRGIIRDVTQQRQLEREVLQAQKLESLGRLAGGIAHDLNNILGIILGHTSLVEHSQTDPAMVASSMGAISKAVQRGAGLVRQILTFARKTDVTLEPVDVNAAIRELSNMLEETIPRTIKLSLELDKGIPTMMMDHTQLHQVLLNLCVNARDAMTDSAPTRLRQGRLTIRTETIDGSQLRRKYSGATAPQYLCITVADTGVGMDEATQQKIFEPFFTTKGLGQGTGLGLAVVYGVVRSHQGQIEVESEVGRGTTFRLFFPVTERAAGPVRMPGAEYGEIPGGTESILLVEDEGGLLLLMESILRRAGYRVLTAVDGVEAVKQYVDHRE